MSILHTVNKSPFQKNDLQSCLSHASEGDAVLLIEDGVYGAVTGTNAASQISASGVSVSVLGPDLAARGIDDTKIADGITVVGYEDFVDLAIAHQAVNSWL